MEAEAQGHGPTELRALPFDDAQDRLVTVETITLPVADKSISGVVVDANGAPAPGLPIFISGPRGSDTAGQPSRRTVSDAEGRFSVDGVCAGPLRIQASFSTLDPMKASDPAWLAAMGDFSFLYASGVLFLVSIAAVIGISLLHPPQDEASIRGLTYASLDKADVRASIGRFDILLTAITLSLVVGMYLYFSFWL